MGSRQSDPNTDQYLPISKQTVGGVAGAIVGSAIAGTVGAMVGGVAGTLMGNRAARGESLVSTRTLNSVRDAVTMLKKANFCNSQNGASLKQTRPKGAHRRRPFS